MPGPPILILPLQQTIISGMIRTKKKIPISQRKKKKLTYASDREERTPPFLRPDELHNMYRPREAEEHTEDNPGSQRGNIVIGRIDALDVRVAGLSQLVFKLRGVGSCCC